MRTKYFPLLLLVATLAACNARQEHEAPASAAASDAGYVQSADSTDFNSGIADMRSSSRKMIRTADFKCRVDNVFTATTELERLVTSVGGIIQDSRMKNEVFSTSQLAYKEDSLKEVQHYRTESFITLRVPVQHLDSVVQAIPRLSAFIEHRTLNQNDVTLNYLSNALKNKAEEENKEEAKAMQLAKKTKDAIAANDYNSTQATQVITRKMENLQMLDNVNYATLTVAFSQPQQVNTTVIMNPDYYNKPGFLVQFTGALSGGWDMMMGLFLFLLNIWPIWLLVIAGVVGYKKFTKRNLLSVRQ